MRMDGVIDDPALSALPARTAQKKPAAQAARPNSGGGSAVASSGGGDWKQKSNALRDAMKSARETSKAIANGEPLPPPVYSGPDLSLVPCPHCGRRFNDKAAERHIPQCKNIIAKPNRLDACE